MNNTFSEIEIDIDLGVFLPCYTHILQNDDIGIEFIWGGRDSGKSHFVAQKLIIECLQSDYFRCIMIKKTFESIKDSQWLTIKDIVEDWGLDQLFKFKTSPLEILCVNGNKFISRGCDNPKKLKSIRNPSHAWYEEGDQISLDDFTTISTTLRSKKTKVTQYFLFNPELPKGIIKKEDFWLYKNYFAHTQEKNFVNEITYTVKNKVYSTKYRSTNTNYLDNLENVTSERITLHENLKKTNPSKYLPYCLGEWGQYSNEIPFFFGYNKQKHYTFEKYTTNDNDYLDISFDFNITPCVAVMGQYNKANKTFHIFDTIEQDHTNIYNISSLQAVVRKIKEKYLDTGLITRSRMRIMGDASGRAGSADRQVSNNFYYTIQRELGLTPQSFFVRKQNLTHITSGEIINNVFINLKEDKLLIHDQEHLERDIESSFPDHNKSLNEAKAKLGLHVLDAWRYLMDFWFNFDTRQRSYVYNNNKKFSDIIINYINN